jgi:hypothetical protein
MDNTNNLSQSLLQPSETSFTSSSLSSDDSGFFSGLKNINATTWIIIILIFAFLGFNIFVYLAKGTQDITNIFAPLLKTIFGTTANVAGQAINISAEGAKAVVGGTAGAIDTGLTAVQSATTPSSAQSTIKGQPIGQQQNKIDIMQQSSLNRALNSAENQKDSQYDYQANEASSSIHGSGQSGWCYVGEERGYRTCAQVGVNDTCMSGDIFPSHEICVNPSLRA